MKRFFIRSFFLVAVPLLGIGIAGYFYFTGGRYVVTENAYIKSRLFPISSDIDGRVVEVAVENNQKLRKGDLLFRLDPESLEIQLAAAQAEVENVRLRVDSLKSRYKHSRLQIEDAEERIRYLASQVERQAKLKQQGHGLEIELEKAEHNLEMGRRALVAAHQESDTVLAELGGDPGIPLEKHALYLAAHAHVEQILRELDLTRVRSPTDGVVSNLTLEAGEYVEKGELVFAVVESEVTWIEANLKESQLDHVAVGQTALIQVDAYPDTEIQAQVTSLSPATGAEFAVLPPQNATGNWVKVVQRIPVRLDILTTPESRPLRTGMTTRVKIDTRHQREIPELLQPVIASVRSLHE